MNSDKRILSAGVAVMDLIMNLAQMPRRSEKFRTHDACVTGGGCAANAAVAIARLGGNSRLAARLGNDDIGDLIVAGLEREGVNCQFVRRYPACRSSFSSIYVDARGERQIVNYRDPDLPRDAAEIEAFDDCDAYLADTRWPEAAVVCMQAARRLGIPGVLDAEAPFDGIDPAFYAASHVFFSAEGLRDYAADADLDTALSGAQGRIGGIVGVTDGANGVDWIDDGGHHHSPAYAINAIDTLGAGDIWHGALALALAEGQALGIAVRFASAAAVIKCTRLGGREGTPYRDEVDALLVERGGAVIQR
jgi:sulfofructose kinase